MTTMELTEPEKRLADALHHVRYPNQEKHEDIHSCPCRHEARMFSETLLRDQ